MQTAIIIPARYHSTRLPAKPLVMIAGKTLLQRVLEVALEAATLTRDTQVFVATDHEDIYQHAESLQVKALMTPEDCVNGTDRVLKAVEQLSQKPKNIINLQGDAPLTPPKVIAQLIETLSRETHAIVTPVVPLSWSALDTLRENKKATPFSGTTAIINKEGYALWFSKNIIPAIRNEEKHRTKSELSPVYQHLGLYGYTLSALREYAALPESHYEALEGLEQLRALENNIPIKAVVIPSESQSEMGGVDTKEDVERVERFLSSRAKD